MKTIATITILALVCALGAFGQTTTPPVGDFLLHAGVSTDFVSHQPSVVTGVSIHVADMAGVPTYSTSAFETAIVKTPGVSNSLTLTTGFLQIPWHAKHFGLYYYSTAGVVKFDLATLGTLNGGAGLYIDLGGIATKDKYHVWLSGGPRQVAISGLQNKPTYLIELTTVLSRASQ